MSQLKILIRPTYSNPPIHGAILAVEVWRNKDLYKEWLGELKIMSGRIHYGHAKSSTNWT